jgi:23S rRNA (cytosine1962-C5)-methyltransferase
MAPAPDRPAKQLRLFVKPAAERQLRSGHPWLYENGIRDENRPGKTGEFGVAYDTKNRFLAIGLYDADSPIRLRVLHAGKPQSLTPKWWQTRLEESLRKREGMFDEQTTGFRWIHGENDGWPGLVLDRYGDTLVLKVYTAAWLPHLPLVQDLVWKRLHPERLVLRSSRNAAQHAPAAERNQSADGRVAIGTPVDGPVPFLETALKLQADVIRGQKTGFFLDQRENRRLVAELASERRVLNAFSFSGAFSLYAARGGARSVTDLDISEHALSSSRDNFNLNIAEQRISSCPHETVKADAFDWLATHTGSAFDLIILDPPSMAKREAERAGALRAYSRLAELALKQLRPRGILVACSCSAHVSSREFFSTIRQAAARSGRAWNELRTTGQPADHPTMFPEAEYLKAIYLRFQQ